MILSGNRTVNEGSNTCLYCKAVAYPTPVKYSWFTYRFGDSGVKKINDSKGEFAIDTLADGRSRLTVIKVKLPRPEENINGSWPVRWYSCSGTNVMGTGKRKAFLFQVNCKFHFLFL